MEYRASVIIPIYNAEKTLRRCVESIIFGEESNIEIILVDDCSKDNSWELCQDLQKAYPQVTAIRNLENKGVSFTRNQGMKCASAERILFVDADDWVSYRYASDLLKYSDLNRDALTVCGFHFINNLDNSRVNYLYLEQSQTSICMVEKEDFFSLLDKLYLQTIWNKVFERSAIYLNNIEFDESQTMGEDFQFVLDYMQALQIERIQVINKTLYYYVRANNVSLMSKFRLVQNQKQYDRYEQLFRLCGSETPKLKEIYEKKLKSIKDYYVYQAVHAKGWSREQILTFIEDVMRDQCADKHYKKYLVLKRKEQIFGTYSKLQQFYNRARSHLQRVKNRLIITRFRKQVEFDSISIISQNCIGGVFYHDMGQQFLSPTINLFFCPSDFIKMVKNLVYYMELTPKMKWDEEYPIGYLDDIEIRFMHYQTCSEALETWERRKRRINWDKILILCTDRDGFDNDMFSEWQTIPYPKVLFTACSYYNSDPSVVYYSEYEKLGTVPDLIPQRKFYQKHRLIDIVNSMTGA